MIRITAKREGFRRCGIAHPASPTEHADDRFSREELEILKKEPMLVVEVTGSRGATQTVPPGENKRPNAKDAIDMIKAMKTVEEIDAFMVGEDRSSVVEAAARQKESVAPPKE